MGMGVHTCEKGEAITYISERERRQRVRERDIHKVHHTCTCKCSMKLGDINKMCKHSMSAREELKL